MVRVETHEQEVIYHLGEDDDAQFILHILCQVCLVHKQFWHYSNGVLRVNSTGFNRDDGTINFESVLQAHGIDIIEQ